MTVTMTLGQLAETLGATLKGPETLQITGLATLASSILKPRMPAAWAMASMIRTPGMMGCAGK